MDDRLQWAVDTIANDCYINGRPVKEVIGEENIPIFVTPVALRKANYNIPRMLQEAVEETAKPEEEQPDGPEPSAVKLEFSIPHNIE